MRSPRNLWKSAAGGNWRRWPRRISERRCARKVCRSRQKKNGVVPSASRTRNNGALAPMRRPLTQINFGQILAAEDFVKFFLQLVPLGIHCARIVHIRDSRVCKCGRGDLDQGGAVLSDLAFD